MLQPQKMRRLRHDRQARRGIYLVICSDLVSFWWNSRIRTQKNGEICCGNRGICFDAVLPGKLLIFRYIRWFWRQVGSSTEIPGLDKDFGLSGRMVLLRKAPGNRLARGAPGEVLSYPRSPSARELHPTDEDMSVGNPTWGNPPSLYGFGMACGEADPSGRLPHRQIFVCGSPSVRRFRMTLHWVE